MKNDFLDHLAIQLDKLEHNGLFKHERIINSQQQAVITLNDGSSVINLCANNYLGLANHPTLLEAAKKAIDQYGFGMSSVRFICGTQTVHQELENRISQ